LTVTCLGFVAGTWFFAPPPATDLVWNMTLVLTAGIIVGFVYKIVRSRSDVMLPMPTEGVMLGIASLASLGVLVFLAQVHAGSPSNGPRITGAENDATGSRIQFKDQKWTFESKRFGIFASSPVIAGGHVYAASSHAAPNCFGYLSKIDLASGEEAWKFGGG